ncbi:YqhR family membrane protein [Halobacillus shinanisalinarum]|uniref:YqhR family membrane protein n=1 Tax=Halobacillus shinanisalinarum TaxID=2932258 RepID=A0ABY4H405_9BACI|nr:YqhR family membrane protein [Halobacillus shinanisalinarum]UOQ93712.1 YqhR family membrane protein [Halobacillus shinanisalinarum]
MADKPKDQDQPKEHKEQSKQEPPHSVLSKTLLIGFIAGILWSGLGAISYYFNFSQVSAATFIFRSFWQTEWTSTLLAEILAVGIVAVLSILVAFAYYVALKGKNGIWPGFIYGIILFGLLFYVMNPIFQAVPDFTQLTIDSLVTTICLFVLYGVFIGYSISYEFKEYNQPAE